MLADNELQLACPGVDETRPLCLQDDETSIESFEPVGLAPERVTLFFYHYNKKRNKTKPVSSNS